MNAARHSLRRLRDGARRSLIAIERMGPLSAAAAAVRRLPRPAPATGTAATPLPGAAFDAIYVVGDRDGEPKRYRVDNPVAALRAQGYAVHVVDIADIDDIRRLGWRARALVLFRAEDDRLAGIAPVLAAARARGMRIVYDIDDLVFDPALAGHIDGLRQMGRYQRHRFIAAMTARRRLLLACDCATVTTPPLARSVAALGIPAAVIPNALNPEQLRVAAGLMAWPRPAGDIVRIGYFSGSRTHQRDFAGCEPALLELMQRQPRLHFRLVGWLDLSPAWRRHGDRVERLDYMPAAALLQAIAETDINLAPLEPGNPFCEAKSELKFFEAAAVGVPTVATATEPFAAAIEDGVSGVLVRDGDWLPALEPLVADRERRRQLGAAARARALDRHAPDAVLPRLIAALGLDPAPRTAAPARLAAAAAG